MTTIAGPSGSVQRPFDPQSDVVLIRDFIAKLVSQVGQNLALHIGDWLWQLHLREDRLPAARENLRIWTGHGGTIQGFCWFRSNHLEIQVDPAASPSGEIEREMLAWAHDRQEAGPDGARADLMADAFEHDARKIGILTDLGFRVTDFDRYDLFRQELNAQVAQATVPTGAEVRAVDPDRDLDDRVAIHREVWHPSKLTASAYAAVRAAPGFLPELDLIAIAPDGTIAAYCTCWYDPVNRIGEFEPVGARAAYRRQGYGLAIMHEGLRRLQRLGATEAIVLSSATNAASYGLYSRSGFTAAGQYHSYVRPASKDGP
jgi:mycothiol synthase